MQLAWDDAELLELQLNVLTAQQTLADAQEALRAATVPGAKTALLEKIAAVQDRVTALKNPAPVVDIKPDPKEEPGL
jgi:hypothetical protein